MVNSQTFPSDSTTAPRCPLATSAAARVGYVSKCQKIGGGGSFPSGALSVIQHPTSPVRLLTGRQIFAKAWSRAESPATNHATAVKNPHIARLFFMKPPHENVAPNRP